jgi:hypothetical protein
MGKLFVATMRNVLAQQNQERRAKHSTSLPTTDLFDNKTHLVHLVCLVYSVCLVCLVEPDRPG